MANCPPAALQNVKTQKQASEARRRREKIGYLGLEIFGKNPPLFRNTRKQGGIFTRNTTDRNPNFRSFGPFSTKRHAFLPKNPPEPDPQITIFVFYRFSQSILEIWGDFIGDFGGLILVVSTNELHFRVFRVSIDFRLFLENSNNYLVKSVTICTICKFNCIWFVD